MTQIKKCSRDGCNPVLQTRGQMKPQDHHAQFNRYGAAKSFMDDHGVWMPVGEFRRDAYEVEDQGPDGASDVRVSCSLCGLATGWDRRDLVETKRHGDGDYRQHVTVRDGNVDAVHERWNAMVAPKVSSGQAL